MIVSLTFFGSTTSTVSAPTIDSHEQTTNEVFLYEFHEFHQITNMQMQVVLVQTIP